MNNLCKILTFFPKDLLNCQSKDIFGSEEGFQFLKDHIIFGNYKIEIYKQSLYEDCTFCNMPSKTNVKFRGHIPFPSKINDDHYSKFPELVPIGTDLVEKDCPSMNATNRKGRFFIQQNRLNNHMILMLVAYMVCGKVRGIYMEVER